jgi:hypothetical protein
LDHLELSAKTAYITGISRNTWKHKESSLLCNIVHRPALTDEHYQKAWENAVYGVKDGPRVGSIYQHYKGNTYQILSVALHTDTEMSLVIYKQVDKEEQVWARPLEDFMSNVPGVGPRFILIKRGISGAIKDNK